MSEKHTSTPTIRKAPICQKVIPMGDSSFQVISQIVVPTIRREGAIVLTENDWKRITAMFEELSPIVQSYQIAGSILAGMCISFLCLCCSFIPSAVPVAGWLWMLGASASCTSGVTSVMCFAFHARLDAVRKIKLRSLRIELHQLAERFAQTGSPWHEGSR